MDAPHPLNTPRTFRPEETSQQKSYTAILSSKTITNKDNPLGKKTNAWPPLTIMTTNHPPKIFLIRKDSVPPNGPIPTPPRYHSRIHQNCQHSTKNTPSLSMAPILSHSNMISTISTIINSIRRVGILKEVSAEEAIHKETIRHVLLLCNYA